MNEEFKQGDIAECPYCGTEFQLDYISEEEYDDFDEYFEHVSACWQEGRYTFIHDLPSV